MTVQDVRKLVDYWISGSDYDWRTALTLFKNKKYPYALFMMHLSLEKALKGLIVKETKDHAHYTHNLAYLAGKAAIEFSKEQIRILEEMNEFNLEARYPDEQKAFYKKANKRFASYYLEKAGEFREWLRKKF